MRAITIRLQRRGRFKRPCYNVVVMFAKSRVQGACLDKIGVYDPWNKQKFFFIDFDKLAWWVWRGATVSTKVGLLLGKIAAGVLVK